MNLVDEEDDLALGVLHLGQHRLQPLLKLATELGTGDERAHVERDELLPLEGLRHVARHDPLRHALGDGGLAHARLTEQDGVVFGPPAEDLDRAANLVVAADHGVELAVRRGEGEVGAVLVKGLEDRLGRLAVDLLPLAQVGERRLEASHRDVLLLDRAGGEARVLLRQRHHQVVNSDERVAHPRLPEARLFDHLLQRRPHVLVRHRRAHLGPLRNVRVEVRLELLDVDARAQEQPLAHLLLALVEQCLEEQL
mmetsp:Transcript_28659/g.77145  ORF Transcript_28659/g.77145 Transcript_28659/m.77145 type:complete len:253 (+) Transcript_28659:445-1203(+)